ncbi:MAG: hypothetical protein JO273_15300, partial [Methylobacteriaceae bacterium]|nr:hypothetical protein [Methylobacteriaceae bacterium]
MNERPDAEPPDGKQSGVPALAPFGTQIGSTHGSPIGFPGSRIGYAEERREESRFDPIKYWFLLLKHRWLFLGSAVISIGFGC